MYRTLLLILTISVVGVSAYAQSATAKKPVEQPVAQQAISTDNSANSAAKPKTPEDATAAAAPTDPALEKDLQAAATPAEEGEAFVTPRETVEAEVPVPVKKDLVVYQPKNRRDPTLSPDDFLLLQYREQQRLAATEAERQRQLAEERRKRKEEERLRQLELARIKDPTREVRNRIKIGGIVGKEVFIGDKVYTIGNKIFGARIVGVTPDSVVFLYKGHKFTKKMQ